MNEKLFIQTFDVVLINGQVINVKADNVLIEFYENKQTLRFFNKGNNRKMLIAEFNMDNIVGWIDNYNRLDDKESEV